MKFTQDVAQRYFIGISNHRSQRHFYCFFSNRVQSKRRCRIPNLRLGR